MKVYDDGSETGADKHKFIFSFLTQIVMITEMSAAPPVSKDTCSISAVLVSCYWRALIRMTTALLAADEQIQAEDESLRSVTNLTINQDSSPPADTPPNYSVISTVPVCVCVCDSKQEGVCE